MLLHKSSRCAGTLQSNGLCSMWVFINSASWTWPVPFKDTLMGGSYTGTATRGWVFSSTACPLPYSNLYMHQTNRHPKTQLMWQALDFHSIYVRLSGTQEKTNNFVYSCGRKPGHWFQRSQSILRKRRWSHYC